MKIGGRGIYCILRVEGVFEEMGLRWDFEAWAVLAGCVECSLVGECSRRGIRQSTSPVILSGLQLFLIFT